MSRTGSITGCSLRKAALVGLGALLACGSRSGLEGYLPAAAERDEGTGSPPRASAPAPSAFAMPAAVEPSEPVLELEGCVDIVNSYTSIPPTVMLLIDASASMGFGFGGSTRWDVLREAIIEPENGLLAWLDASASIGLMFYTSLDGFRSGLGCPLVAGLDAQFANAEQIRERYLREEPLEGGDTPTAEGIDAAVSQLGAAAPGSPKYVLLITDGDPDTCAVPDPQQGGDAAVEAVQRAFAQGTTVRTVGVSPEIARFNLQRMANAAAGKSLDLVFQRDQGAEQPLYASTEPSELADQLKGVIGDVRTCTIELGTEVGHTTGTEGASPLEGRVMLDRVVLEYGAADGWSFVDEDTLVIHGPACERILGSGQRLEVTFPCQVHFPGEEIR